MTGTARRGLLGVTSMHADRRPCARRQLDGPSSPNIRRANLGRVQKAPPSRTGVIVADDGREDGGTEAPDAARSIRPMTGARDTSVQMRFSLRLFCQVASAGRAGVVPPDTALPALYGHFSVPAASRRLSSVVAWL
jgi:hypothetical protein